MKGMVCLGRPYHFKFSKGCLPQISFGTFFNTLTWPLDLFKPKPQKQSIPYARNFQWYLDGFFSFFFLGMFINLCLQPQSGNLVKQPTQCIRLNEKNWYYINRWRTKQNSIILILQKLIATKQNRHFLLKPNPPWSFESCSMFESWVNLKMKLSWNRSMEFTLKFVVTYFVRK